MAGVTLDEPAAYFERLADFEANHWWSAATWRVADRWLDRSLRGRSGLTALDVGCGAGLTLRRLAARPEVGPVIGVDPLPEALAYAKGRGGRVVGGSALALPFEAGWFDLATCLDVLQHLPSGGEASAARELARVLGPGGVVVVRVAAGRGGDRVGMLRETFEVAGFRVERATRVNAIGSIAQEVRGRLRPGRHRSHPDGGGLPAPSPPGPASRLLGAIGRAEAYAVGRLGLDLPFGHSAMLLATRA